MDMPHKRLTEAEVIIAVNNKDYVSLLQSVTPLIFKLCDKICANKGRIQDVDDCFQFCCKEFLRLMSNYDPTKSQLSTYVTTAVRRWALRYLWEDHTIRINFASRNQYLHLLDIHNDRDIVSHSIESTAFDEIYQQELVKIVRQAMYDCLTWRERIVVKGRMHGLTLQYLGYRLRVTRERIRQINDKAIKKLQQHLSKMRSEVDPATL